MSPDPWTSFLDWLSTVLVPSWGELISLLPMVILGTIVGPILTLIVAMWVWHFMKRRGGRVKRAEPAPSPAALDANGSPLFPTNVPYCEHHALLYPPRATECAIDAVPLRVACPVDGTVRSVRLDTCSACGTRYILGAGTSSAVVLSTDGPPEGGAAIA